MAFLSQASHLGSLLLPHNAFQEHAAHPAEWSAALNSKGSERTCIRSGLATFLHDAFTAHSHLVVKSQVTDIYSFALFIDLTMPWRTSGERRYVSPVDQRRQ